MKRQNIVMLLVKTATFGTMLHAKTSHDSLPDTCIFPSSPMNVVVKTPPDYPDLRKFCIFRHLNLGENRLIN